MNVKKLALLVGALVIAVITAVMAKNMFAGAGAQQANAAPAVPVGPKVLVAKKALPVGTIIDAEREQQRIRENQALGRPATSGDTPIIRRRQRGILEGLF